MLRHMHQRHPLKDAAQHHHAVAPAGHQQRRLPALQRRQTAAPAAAPAAHQDGAVIAGRTRASSSPAAAAAAAATAATTTTTTTTQQRAARAAAEAAIEAASQAAAPPSSDYVPSPTAVGRAQQLTAHIRRRRHWSQLQNIWLDNSSSFSTIHLTATLTRVAQLVAEQGVAAADVPELFKFSSAVMSCLHQRLPELDARGAAQCLHAYAKLQSCCPHHSSSGDAAADALAAELTARHMPMLQRQELSQAAWAAATLQPLGLRLPGGWWSALEQRLLVLLPVVQPAEVACCAWAAAKSHHTPPQAFVEALLEHADANDDASSSSSRHRTAGGSSSGFGSSIPAVRYGAGELLQLLLAMAAWKQRPPLPWLRRTQQQLQHQVPVMNQQDVSNTLLAFARLGFRPSQPFLGRLLQRLQHLLPRSCPQVLVTVPYALAKLSLSPGRGWWPGFLPYTTVSLHSYSSTGLALSAWSLCRLGVDPGQPWLQELLQESGSRLRQQVPGHSGFVSRQGFAAQELALLAWALGKWGAAPQPDWWEVFEVATAARLEDFTAAELGALLCGMGNTAPALAGAGEQPTTARTTLAHMLSKPGSSSDSESSSGTSRAALDWFQQQQQQQQGCPPYSPSAVWVSLLLQTSEKALAGAPAGCLAGILMGMAKLRIRPGSGWLAAFQAAVMAALPQATLRDVAALLWGFAVLQIQPSRSLLQGMFGRIEQQLTHGRRLWLLQQCQASAAVQNSSDHDSDSSRFSPSPATNASAEAAEPAAGIRGTALSPAVAAQLLWSLANLPVPAEATWLDDMLVAVSSDLATASSDTLVTLLWCLARLHHVPGWPGWLDCWWSAYSQQLQADSQLRHAQQPRLRFAAAAGAEQLGAEPPTAAVYVTGEDRDDEGLVPLLLVLSSFRRLKAAPSVASGWLPVLLDVVAPHLATASSSQLCLLLTQLVGLHVWPGEPWLAAAVAAVQRRHCSLAEAGLERVVQDLQLLGCGQVELMREACLVD